jgi:hypothetical protein
MKKVNAKPLKILKTGNCKSPITTMSEISTIEQIVFNKEQALYIKHLRKSHTWRSIAGMFSPFDCNGQIFGKLICDRAAEILGESQYDWK